MAAERLGTVTNTVFGSMWRFTNGELKHQDTAFTSVDLGSHTDNTYFNAPAGIQVRG